MSSSRDISREISSLEVISRPDNKTYYIICCFGVKQQHIPRQYTKNWWWKAKQNCKFFTKKNSTEQLSIVLKHSFVIISCLVTGFFHWIWESPRWDSIMKLLFFNLFHCVVCDNMAGHSRSVSQLIIFTLRTESWIYSVVVEQHF